MVKKRGYAVTFSIIPSWFRDDAFKCLFKNAGILLSGNVGASLLGLASLALTARALGPERLGILVLIQTYIAIVDRLFNFQSWQAIIKYGAEALEHGRRDDFKGLIKFGTILDMASAIVATVVAILAAYWIGQWKGWDQKTINMIMSYSIVILFHLSGTPTAILRLFDRFKLFAIQQIITSAFKLGAVVFAFLSNAGLWEFILIWMATDVLGNLLLLFFGWSLLAKKAFTGWWHAKCEEWQKVFKFTWWTNITSTFDLPVKQFDIVIVGTVVSLEAVGLYKIFKQVTLILTQVADPIYQVIYPQFSTLLAQGKARKAVHMAVKTGVILLLFSLPMAFIISLLSPWWINTIFGEAYTKELLTLGVYLFLRAVSIGFISIHPLFIAMGFVRYNIAILAVSNTFYVLAAWFLGGIFGLIGIVMAYGIQFSSVLIPKYCLISNSYKRSP